MSKEIIHSLFSELGRDESALVDSIHQNLATSTAQQMDEVVLAYYENARQSGRRMNLSPEARQIARRPHILATNRITLPGNSSARPMATNPNDYCLDSTPDELQEEDDECGDEGGVYDLENCECNDAPYEGSGGGGEAPPECPAPPTSESTVAVGANPASNTLTNFQMTLSGGSGNFSNWIITEYAAQQGEDSCYNSSVNPAYVPEYPAVEGSTWPPVSSSNQWGPDSVGFIAGSVEYIRNNSPYKSSTPIITTFPCGFVMYQALSAQCSSNSPIYLYDPQVTLTGTVNKSSVTNCREGICSTLNN